MTDQEETIRLLLSGVAAGDALGATSEFCDRDGVKACLTRYGAQGWPWVPVGGGTFDWKPGAATDDTSLAMCIVRSFLRKGRFAPEDVAGEFVAWAKTGPRDIGGTTATALRHVAAGHPWHQAGYLVYRGNPSGAANGSLMRNGVIPALAADLDEAFLLSVWQGEITHYAPLSVLCCCLQTWLIWRLAADRTWPFSADDWLEQFHCRFWAWLEDCGDGHVNEWFARVRSHLLDAWQALIAADWSPYSFNPFTASFQGRAGYSLLTLQIAVWALAWSIMEDDFPTPANFPADVFARRGAHTLGWVALVGQDADTYGAVAGPLLVAAHGDLPSTMTDGLAALAEFDALAARKA